MITISNVVEEIIKQKPFLTEAIADGIINFSGLARNIQPEIEKRLSKDVNYSAIVMSLKRLAPTLSANKNSRLNKMLSNLGEIIIRSNLSEITYSNSDTLLNNQMRLWKEHSYEDDVFYTVSRGVFETTYVFSNQMLNDIKSIFEKENLKSSTDNLASLTIKLPKDNNKQVGLYYSILKNLAWEGITIYETISTTNEFSIVVNDTDVSDSLVAINKLKL